jgi:hypothetical protein
VVDDGEGRAVTDRKGRRGPGAARAGGGVAGPGVDDVDDGVARDVERVAGLVEQGMGAGVPRFGAGRCAAAGREPALQVRVSKTLTKPPPAAYRVCVRRST